MLTSGTTLATRLKQVAKSTSCRICGVRFEYTSRTIPPKVCDSCGRESRRALDRIRAEKKRRLRGVVPLKGTIVPCAKCSGEFVRTNIKHIYCGPCGEANYVARTRKASRDKHATKEGRDYTNKWLRDRHREDPSWRVSRHVRVMMHRGLRSQKQGRSWRQLVSYTLSDLMAHLERKFLPGMTWKNYGKWHIDHRRPLASFSFSSSDDPQFKEAWALSNLQPLWALDNIRKNAKII